MTENSYLTMTLVCLFDICRANLLQEKRTLSLISWWSYCISSLILFFLYM